MNVRKIAYRLAYKVSDYPDVEGALHQLKSEILKYPNDSHEYTILNHALQMCGKNPTVIPWSRRSNTKNQSITTP